MAELSCREADVSESDQVEISIEHLFTVDESLPCPVGRDLLRAFAEARPADFAFLQCGDLVDLNNSAFAGIPEWDVFATHYGRCELCNA